MTFYWRSGRTRLDLPMQRSSGLCRLAWLLAVALIALLFGAGAPAQALSQPLTHLHHYVYDADVHHSDLTSNATERGPPTAWDTHQGRTAVGRASNGALASPATATVSVSYDYDGRPQFVQVAQSGNTDPKPVGAPTGQFSSAHPSQVAAKTLAGSGPVPGVLEASGRVKSFAALRNYNPNGGIEYVFDPATGTFAVGRPAASAGLKGSPHEQLAQSIGANPSTVVGGTLARGGNGAFITTEQSGHFWQNWTPEIRQQFVGTMRGYGFDVVH